jgi:RNA polymerase sigma-70 factor (ECF subfamily)
MNARRETFERLYREHAGRVKAYGLRRVGSEAAADEVVSDVFLVVWRRLDAVPDDPLPWLLGIARNAVANRHRSERRATALQARIADTERAPVAEPPGPGDLLGGDDPVVRALARLPDRDRELLMLVAWEGLEPAQLARVLGVSRGTANVRLHRARRRLATALATDRLKQPQEVTK